MAAVSEAAESNDSTTVGIGQPSLHFANRLPAGHASKDRFYSVDEVALNADTNLACNIRERLYDQKIMLYTPHREEKRLLLERTRTVVGTAPPRLKLQELATRPLSTESEGTLAGTIQYWLKEQAIMMYDTLAESLKAAMNDKRKPKGRPRLRQPF